MDQNPTNRMLLIATNLIFRLNTTTVVKTENKSNKFVEINFIIYKCVHVTGTAMGPVTDSFICGLYFIL